MECKECYSLTRITRNILTVDHMKVMHSSCTDQSKLSVSTWIRPFCSCCRVVCYFPNCSSSTSIAERQNCLPLSWQAYSARSRSLISWKLFVLDLTSALSETIVFDLRSVKRQRWSTFSPLSAQLSCQPVTYFGLFMKYRHSFATILPQFYHNFTTEPLCSPQNKSTVCNNTRSKHGAIVVQSQQIQCRLSRPIGLFMKYRLVWFHICPLAVLSCWRYLSMILNKSNLC